jgi:hypothetical protein
MTEELQRSVEYIQLIADRAIQRGNQTVLTLVAGLFPVINDITR